MTTTRQSIGQSIAKRASASYVPAEAQPVQEAFGLWVFNDSEMRQRLPKEIYKTLKKTISNHDSLDPSISDTVAAAMKDWAVDLGATHYTHWFQPLTGLTAEKHDAFLTTDDSGRAIQQFSGSALTQGEPDASSFPSGGIRATFEARGYTAWDPTSPAFVRMSGNGATLFIPTAFCSYTGEALDKKTPLLRSEAALSKAGSRLMQVLGSKKTEKVFSTAGLEQEYFLIDMEYFNARPDMVATGRTLFGTASYKGQSMDDHYFGAIKTRVLNFMDDTETNLYKLGIPVKTRHNEVAPGQYEVAPVFESANMAVDHNMLVMEVMKEIAAKHGFKMLVHEKPFAGLNGSGKHCNWSMADNNGQNLLEPGKTPHDNMQFLVVLAAIIRGVDKYAKLMRITVAHAGNDHRLGANEAPPAIISVYLGDELNRIVEEMVKGTKPGGKDAGSIQLGSTVLPHLPKDNTDRNRTSPFAFTGNKFEFRALGASQHVAGPVFFINTIVADSLDYVSDQIEAAMKGGAKLEDAADQVVKAVFKEHQRVIFNGDGYSQEWEEEAAKRGLPNLKSTPEATKHFMDDEAIELFGRYGVLSKGEIESRYNIKLENYILAIEIEANATRDMARNMIVPAAVKYQSILAESIAQATAAGAAPKAQKNALVKLTTQIDELLDAIDALDAIMEVEHGEDPLVVATHTREKVIPLMDAVREKADPLETMVDDSLWPLPKYREMLLIS